MLFDALDNDDYVIRQEACGALGSVGGADAIRKLNDIAQQDPHSSVRSAAKIALNRVETAHISDMEKAKLLEVLVTDENKRVRSWAVRALATECGREGRTVLQKVAEEESPAGQKSRWYLIMMENAPVNTEQNEK